MNTYIDTFNLVSAEASLAERCATLRVEMILLASPEPEEIDKDSLFESFVSTFRTYDVTYLKALLATLTESYNEMTQKHSQNKQTKVKHMKTQIPNRHPNMKNPLKLYRERTEHSQRDISIYTDISQSRISRLESLSPLHFIRAVSYFEIYSFNDYFNTFCNEVQTEVSFIDYVHMFTESNNFNIKYRI